MLVGSCKHIKYLDIFHFTNSSFFFSYVKVILDVFVCNAAGIYLGIKTCRFLEVKEYDWAGGSRKNGKYISALKKGVRQLSPQQFDPFHWDVLSSGKRFFAVCLLITLIEIVELNAFFLKFVLWIPPPHYLNILRLILWFFIGMPAIRESYQFATQRFVLLSLFKNLYLFF